MPEPRKLTIYANRWTLDGDNLYKLVREGPGRRAVIAILPVPDSRTQIDDSAAATDNQSDN